MPAPRVAVTGASGQLGLQLVRAFDVAGASVHRLVRPAFDLTAADRLDVLRAGTVDVVVNAAAWTEVDACARDPARARELNGSAVGFLATLAAAIGARFIQVSTNEVFDGSLWRGYREDDEPNPVNAYGASKLLGERLARSAAPDAVIVRTAWIYGGPRSFPVKILAAAERAAAAGERLRVVADEIGNPTPAGPLADRIVAVALSDEPPPVIHLAGEPPVSRHAWATRILAELGMGAPDAIALRDFQRASTPPPHAVLDTSLSRSQGLEPITWIDGGG